jgi:hypothetical protein
MQKYILLLLSVLLVACGTSDGPRLPAASGKAGEMVVVMNKTRWEGHSGELVRKVFASSVPMLPQEEPHFNLYQIEHSAFASLFETHRNILIIDFDPSLDKGRIEVKRDQWSYPQMIINIKVPHEEVLERLLEVNGSTLISHYLKTERERLINAYKRMINYQAQGIIKERLGLDLTIPEGYFVAKQEDNFVWLRQTGTREELELGLMITILPYKNAERDFSQKTIWARRDSITRKHIPGTFAGTYMTTYPDLPPAFQQISFNDMYAMEARGFWRIKDDFMGGPFINITFVDEKNGRLINMDGFVYAPKFEKRDYLRQVEAMIYSIRIPDEDSSPES